jgi:hypothetical protein
VNWILSFLYGRSQCVRVGDSLSSCCRITSGVPQGSVLGPLLFSMVIDKLSCVSSNSMCLKYADDVTFLHFVRNASEDKLQFEWDNVRCWSSSNCLPVNFSKCSVMDIITKKSLTLHSICDSEGNVVQNVKDVTLLGVKFCADLRWNLHIDTIVKKSSKRMYIFYNLLRSGCPPHLFLMAYLAYVRSILLYCYPVFCNAPDYLKAKLVRIEKRVCRMTSAILREDLVTAADDMCSRLFSTIESNAAHPLRVLFETRQRTPRNILSLRPPLARTKRYSASFIKFARAS